MPRLKKKATRNDMVALAETRAQNGIALPSPRVGPLNSQRGVRSQVAKIYRRTMRGEISPQDAAKLTYCLHTLSKIIETETFENRLEQLERTVEGQAHADRI